MKIKIVAKNISFWMFFIYMLLSNKGVTQTTIWFEDFESGGSSWTFTPNTSDNRWIVNNVYAGGTYMALGMMPYPVPDVADQSLGITNYPNSNYLHILNMDDVMGLGGAAAAGIVNANYSAGISSSNENAISSNIDLTSHTNIKVSYWWLCQGGSISKGTISYSIDNGTTWNVLGSHSGSAQWVYVSHDLPITANNQPNFKLKINWTDQDGDDPPFSIDDIRVYTDDPPQNPTNISGVILSATPLCEKKAVNNYSVKFDANGTFDSANQFIVEISDASGSFTSPTQIGTLAESTSGSKTIMCNIPATLPYGTGYKIRVRSTSPVFEVETPIIVHPFPKLINPIPTADIVFPDCNVANGSIKVTATDGTGNNYHFNLSPEGGTQTNAGSQHFFNNLLAGTYNIYVKDGSDDTCQDTVSVTLTAVGMPKVITSFDNITCYGDDDGAITITATNGVPPYIHTLKDSQGNIIHTETHTSPNSIVNYDDLPADTYTVTVVDANSCPYTEEIKIGKPELVFKVIAYDANCGATTGAIAWNVSGGSGTLKVSINGTEQTHGDTITKSLQPDTYVVKLSDDSGCFKDTTVIINAGQGGVIDSAQVVIVHSGCNGPCSGSIVATSPTATSYTLNNITNNTGVFNNLCHGNVDLIVSNGTGCELTQKITIMSVDPPVADFGYSPSNPTTFSPQVTFHNYSMYAKTYEWTISDLRTGTSYSTKENSFSHIFTSPDSNLYHVCLKASNEYGCSNIICKDIAIQDEIMLFIPNTFTPDDNEYNQTWKITAIGIDNQNFSLEVFNRWGEIIYESKDYSINWDATHDGVPVPEGMYSWRITVKDPINDYRKIYTGNVNIIR